MTKRILIIGAYGNFGSYISEKLSQEDDFQVIVAGRTEGKCKSFAENLGTEYCVLDINEGLVATLREIGPDIVIHTSGPYQDQGYDVAEACITVGCHYIDLADGRTFVRGITTLDQKAKEAGIMIISGASSVPCLTSAVIDHHLNTFDKLTEIDYGITTSQHTNTGLATASAVLSYAGKPFKTLINGKMKNVYGWQDLHWRKFSGIGWRALSNCDIPDLSLFPERYPDLRTQRFYAGLEINTIHIGLWLMTWLVRWRLLPPLSKMSGFLLKILRLFDFLGSGNSGFYMTMSGTGKDGQPHSKTFTIIAKRGHGAYIPSIPAILCAKILARGQSTKSGARPCVGIIGLDQYLAAFKGLDIKSFNQS